MQHLTIIKIGGKVINQAELLRKVLQDFSDLEGKKILVHGGGRKASEVLAQMNITPKMVAGRRITDAETLEVVAMVYAGLINKQVVALLQAFGCQSIGLSGADLNSIQAHKRLVKEIDYGFAGDIDAVNTMAVAQLLEVGVTPVFCPITHDRKGQLLNTNADTIAAALAVALSSQFEVSLKYCFEKKGVLLDVNDEDSVIEMLSRSKYEQYKKTGIIYEGMLPKIDNAFLALHQGVQQVYICGTTAINEKATQTGTRLQLED